MIAVSIATLMLAAGGQPTEAENALCAKAAQVMEVATTTGEFADNQEPLTIEIRRTARAVQARYSSQRSGPGSTAFDQLGRTEFNRRFTSDSQMGEVWALVQVCSATGRPG